MEEKKVLSRFAIVVADRGFVFVGDANISDDWCVITGCKNIRRWGTTCGLGELAEKGPREKTVLDECGVVRIPMDSVACMLDSDGSKWQ